MLHGDCPVSATDRFAEAPLHIVAEPETVAVGLGFTVITTLWELEQLVAVMVSVTVYVVVTVGVTTGLDVVELKPAGFEDQVYVSPQPQAEAPICTLPPLQIDVLLPAFAAG